MKLNATTTILGKNVVLVPYRENHVLKYHKWMKSEVLQRLTASEPLTLEAEYQMQKTWREDDDKCTFIVLEKEKYIETLNEIDCMIGDTNIFITDKETSTGEIEIMIAEESARGRKLGWEAVILMLLYGINYIKLNYYEAKINTENIISLQMFQKLGFIEISRSEVFSEVTLYKQVNSEWIEWLKSESDYELKTDPLPIYFRSFILIKQNDRTIVAEINTNISDFCEPIKWRLQRPHVIIEQYYSRLVI